MRRDGPAPHPVLWHSVLLPGVRRGPEGPEDAQAPDARRRAPVAARGARRGERRPGGTEEGLAPPCLAWESPLPVDQSPRRCWLVSHSPVLLLQPPGPLPPGRAPPPRALTPAPQALRRVHASFGGKSSCGTRPALASQSCHLCFCLCTLVRPSREVASLRTGTTSASLCSPRLSPGDAQGAGPAAQAGRAARPAARTPVRSRGRPPARGLSGSGTSGVPELCSRSSVSWSPARPARAVHEQ